MTLSEYSPKRAEILRHSNFPQMELPVPLKIQWFEAITTKDLDSHIYRYVHSHTFFEIHFVFSGSVSYQCGKQKFTLHAQQALFLPPELPHKFLSPTADLLKVSIAFAFSDSVLPFWGEKAQKFDFPETLVCHFQSILQQCENSLLFTPLLLVGKIAEILDSSFALLSLVLPERPRPESDSRLTVARNFIDRNIHRALTCEDVAKECCISVKQLSRIFKSCTGNTLFEEITQSRIHFAQKLLCRPELSIKEISFQLGFEQESGFAAFFKRHCGISPGMYRKRQAAPVAYLPENVRK